MGKTNEVERTFAFIRSPVFGLFVLRLNRFVALVKVRNQWVRAYLPNSGRLEELLIEGRAVILEERRKKGKTLYDLLMIQTPSFPQRTPIWVALDSRLPPLLLKWAIEGGFITDFGDLRGIQLEPSSMAGRLDLLLTENDGTLHLVETKSVNLLDKKGCARFPDAPTERGRKHLKDLGLFRKKGYMTWLVFVVMREDARAFTSFEQRDPEFTEALISAHKEGVQIRAISFGFSTKRAEYKGKLTVILPPPSFPGLWPSLD